MAKHKFAVRIGRGNIIRFTHMGSVIDYLRILVRDGQLEPLLFAMEEVKISYNGRLEKISEEHLNRIMGIDCAETNP